MIVTTCHRGLEDVAALDCKELLSSEATTHDGYVRCDGGLADASLLAYRCQSALGVYLELGTFASVDELKADMPDLSPYLSGKRFMVTASCEDEQQVREDVGAAIVSKLGLNVDLTSPERIVHVLHAGDSWLLLLDVAGIDLGKRSYRIFLTSKALKATLAYGLVRLSGYAAGETLIDPFCRDGTIPIEAALWTLGLSVRQHEREKLLLPPPASPVPTVDRLPVLAFDSLFRHVDSARKNAKIAGVHKAVDFARLDISWLDTKYGEGEVDRIVTRIPDPGKHTDEKRIAKLQQEFFHQIGFVLSKKGSAVICTHHPEVLEPQAHGFSVEKRKVWQGQEELEVLVLRRS